MKTEKQKETYGDVDMIPSRAWVELDGSFGNIRNFKVGMPTIVERNGLTVRHLISRSCRDVETRRSESQDQFNAEKKRMSLV